MHVQENITRAVSLLRPGCSLPQFWQCSRQLQPPPLPPPPPPPQPQRPPQEKDAEWARRHPPLNLSSFTAIPMTPKIAKQVAVQGRITAAVALLWGGSQAT